jgi:hypothetical protein
MSIAVAKEGLRLSASLFKRGLAFEGQKWQHDLTLCGDLFQEARLRLHGIKPNDPEVEKLSRTNRAIRELQEVDRDDWLTPGTASRASKHYSSLFLATGYESEDLAQIIARQRLTSEVIASTEALRDEAFRTSADFAVRSLLSIFQTEK